MGAEGFFSEEENQRISATIKAVEGETAGEIAVLVVEESDTYPEAILLGAVILGGLAALALTDLFLDDSLWLFIPCLVAGALVAALVLQRIPVLHRLFVSPQQINRRVAARAEQAFYARGLHRTREGSGVLFFLSLFERQVWVLADQGIYRKIDQEALQAYARAVVLGMKNGRKTEALCAEIVRFGRVLAHHFPIRPDDVNELSNEVMVEAKGSSTRALGQGPLP